MCCDNLIVLFINLILLGSLITDGSPAPHRTIRSSNRNFIDYTDDVQNYLMEFGYLPKSNIETGNLRTEEQLREAIKNLQNYGNIPATGVVDEAAKKLMKKARCGVPDTDLAPDFNPTNRKHGGRRRSKRYLIQGPRWDSTAVTWSLVNQTMTTLDAGQVRRVFYEALKVWERNSKLTFSETHPEDADIQVMFARREHGDGYDFDGPGAVLAHAFYPGTGRGGDAHFDEEEKWIISGSSQHGTDLMGVAVHEFGHSLGLGHSSVQDAIMFPWYHNFDAESELPEDDRIAIQQIYGSREEKQWGRNPYHNPARTTSTTTTTTTTTTPRPYYPDRPRYYPNRTPNRNPTRDDPYDRNDPRIFTERPIPRDREPLTPRVTERPREWEPRTERPRTERPRVFERPRETEPRTERPRHRPDHPYPRYPNSYPDHPRHHTTVRPRHNHHNHNPKSEKPNTCDTSYDAISIIRGELFIFKDRYLWRFGEQGLYAGYPHEIKRLWSSLPDDFTHVDAVYENKDLQIVFFIGRQYYVFNSNRLAAGYPRPLTDLGISPAIPKIDAALVWGYNNRTYFYSGTLYWRFDEETKKVELDYPRDMSMWRGIGYHIDTAFQWKDGKTYFFKDRGFWKFDDYNMRVAHDKQLSSAQHWMGCPRETNEIDEPKRKEPLLSGFSGASNCWHRHSFVILITTLVTIFINLRNSRII